MELTEAVRRRRMCRAFTDQPVAGELLDALVGLALRAPSAGFTQGTEVLVCHGPEQMARFWQVAATPAWRAAPDHPGLLRAAAAVVPLAAPAAYASRYAEPDKARPPGGPWHTVDAAMVTMTLLLAATDAGLGALLTGLGGRLAEVAAAFGVPAGFEPVGAVLVGWPDPTEAPTGSPRRRPRRPDAERVHRGGW